MERSDHKVRDNAQDLQQHDIAATLARFEEDWYAVTKSLSEIQILVKKQHENLRMMTAITLRLSQIRTKYSCHFFHQEQLEQSTDHESDICDSHTLHP